MRPEWSRPTIYPYRKALTLSGCGGPCRTPDEFDGNPAGGAPEISFGYPVGPLFATFLDGELPAGPRRGCPGRCVCATAFGTEENPRPAPSHGGRISDIFPGEGESLGTPPYPPTPTLPTNPSNPGEIPWKRPRNAPEIPEKAPTHNIPWVFCERLAEAGTKRGAAYGHSRPQFRPPATQFGDLVVNILVFRR